MSRGVVEGYRLERLGQRAGCCTAAPPAGSVTPYQKAVVFGGVHPFGEGKEAGKDKRVGQVKLRFRAGGQAQFGTGKAL